MPENFRFGVLDTERLHEALALVREVFLKYEAPEYPDEGIREFMRFIEPEAIHKMLTEKAINIWTCEDGDKIVGVLGARADHINLLFVGGAYHRRGIARRLFGLMMRHFSPRAVTVNSSPYAVLAYRKLGFVETGAEQTINGIRFIPMKFTPLSIISADIPSCAEPG